MRTHLEGRVENLSFKPQKEVFLPLFEAIANSLESIIHNKVKSGSISISIERDDKQLSVLPVLTGIGRNVRNIVIVDNGVGFTDENAESFKLLDSRLKKSLGCKGIGRLFWLKTFDRVEVDSVFSRNGSIFRRRFTFSLPNGYEEIDCIEIDKNSPPLTTIRLCGYIDEYEQYFGGKRLSTVKSELISYFLTTFYLADCPVISLSDGDLVETIGKRDLPPSKVEKTILKGQPFYIHHIKVERHDENSHTLNFCAANRVAKSMKLETLIPFTKKKLFDDTNGFYYLGYVTSPFLDKVANGNRNDFDIDYDSALSDKLNVIYEKEIQDRVIDRVKKFLTSYISEMQTDKRSKIDAVLLDEMAPLSYVKAMNPKELETIPVDASEDEIKRHITLIHYQNHIDSRKQAEGILDLIDKDGSMAESQFLELYSRDFESFVKIHQADLAQYVLYRKWVLSLFSKAMSKRTDDKHFLEDAVHNIVFPMRLDATSGSPASHNLWIVDDRFSFFDYIASDLEFHKHKILGDGGSERRPDICGYFFCDDRDDGFASSVVIIEFKRPGREQYKKYENPVQQVMDYVKILTEGNRDGRNQEIPISTATRFYCYIICDVLNDKIKDYAALSRFTKTIDGQGYFLNFDDRTYIEIISFKKLLGDAIKRNDVFFKKLGISKKL